MPAKRENIDAFEPSPPKRQQIGLQSSSSQVPPAEESSIDVSESSTQTVTSAAQQQTKKLKKPKEITHHSTLTVKSIMPSPATDVIDEDQVKSYSETLRHRLNAISSFQNLQANIFSLPHLLPTACWGKNDPYTDRGKLLCNLTTNEPVMIWIVGHISSTWFMKNNEPDRQCSVTIVPLSKAITRHATQLLSGFSEPKLPSVDDMLMVIRATHWQSSKQGEAPTLFTSVYDARDVLRAKTEMSPYPPMLLKKKDLVLLEVRLSRYFVKGDGARYSQHRAQFELHAISLLHSYDEDDEEQSSDQDIADLHI